MIERLLIATSNLGKYREMAGELEPLGLPVTSLEEEGIALDRPESGDTYRENAAIKAREGFEKSRLPSLADDSGLEVDALGGEPGVYSDRWAGDVTANERNRLLLERLEEASGEERTARFVCEMVLVDEDEVRFGTRGVCEGRIAEEPRGDRGFGYDPIFEVEEREFRTFGELGSDVKRTVSHRARALEAMIEELKQSFESDQTSNS